MSKIRTEKIVFFYDKYVNSTIMVDSYYWNSIGSWIPTHKNLLLAHFIIRAILDPKFPLMVLMQEGHVIEYESRKLKIHEKNYATYDLEFHAIIHALIMWLHNLIGRIFY